MITRKIDVRHDYVVFDTYQCEGVCSRKHESGAQFAANQLNREANTVQAERYIVQYVGTDRGEP